MLNQQIQSLDDAVIVAFGSNLSGGFPSSRRLLDTAMSRLRGLGLTPVKASRWWRSAAWPDTEHPDYLNGVALVETGLGPSQVLAMLRSLEAAFGRTRHTVNGPRTLDLDLIAHGRTLMNTEALILPHPRAHLRRFVMGPLAEIAPDWTHPSLGLTAAIIARTAPIGLDSHPIPDERDP